jgi:hypothetical protein
MITPWYIAVESFSPDWEDGWTKYVEWSGLTQLEEVISLDMSLCPCVVKTLEDEDWNHNVQEDYVTDFFRDLSYLRLRVVGIERVSFLAAVRNPEVECRDAFHAPHFVFKGYDLVEGGTGMSALTNCGGFPLAFSNSELSSAGLVTDLKRALEIQAALVENYPDEHHADCDVWALWREEPGTEQIDGEGLGIAGALPSPSS